MCVRLRTFINMLYKISSCRCVTLPYATIHILMLFQPYTVIYTIQVNRSKQKFCCFSRLNCQSMEIYLKWLCHLCLVVRKYDSVVGVCMLALNNTSSVSSSLVISRTFTSVARMVVLHFLKLVINCLQCISR